MARLSQSFFSKRKSVLRKWMLTYFLVLLIPLVASMYGYLTSYRIIEKEIQASNLMSLELLSSVLDQKINSAKQLSNQILMDQRLKDFLRKRNLEDERRVYQMDVMELISTYCQTSSISDILLYIPELDYCVTTKVSSNLSKMYDALYYTVKPNITKQQWREELSHTSALPLISSVHLSYNHFNKKALVYQASSSALPFQNSYTTNIFISLQLTEMERILDSNKVSSLLIMDRSGKIIESFGAAPPVFQLPDKEENEYQLIETESGTYVCSFHSSDASGLIYATVTPSQLYWNQKYYFTTISTVTIFLSCVLGIGMSIYLLYKNYTPLSQLIQRISERGNDDKNEFDLLDQTFQRLSQESDSIRNKNLQQNTYLEAAYLRAILMGSRMEPFDQESAKKIEKRLEGNLLKPVAIYALNRRESLLAKERNRGNEVSLSFLLENVLHELLQNRFSYEKTSFQDTVVFVFTIIPNEIEFFEEQLLPAVSCLQKFFEKHFSLNLEAVIGNDVDNVKDLSYVYQRIKIVHIQNRLKEQQRILFLEGTDENPTNSLENFIAQGFVQVLGEAVRQSSWEEAKQDAEILFQAVYESDKTYINIHFYIVAIVYGILEESADNHFWDTNEESFSLLEEIILCKKLESLKRNFLKLLQLLCSRLSEPDILQEEGISLQVKRYIYEHYADINLNLEQISDHIGLSPKYISRLFKDETEKRLPDFITEIRIQKAKELMTCGAFPLHIIAEKVGYSNVKTFRRAFQKIENMNPSDYKGRNMDR